MTETLTLEGSPEQLALIQRWAATLSPAALTAVLADHAGRELKRRPVPIIRLETGAREEIAQVLDQINALAGRTRYTPRWEGDTLLIEARSPQGKREADVRTLYHLPYDLNRLEERLQHMAATNELAGRARLTLNLEDTP